MSRILVVEDDPAILRGIADNLRFEGYDVISASDGITGWRLMQGGGADVVLLDLMLPGLSGYELCRRARAERIQTPIIMLTARGEETDRVLGLDLGADDYVTKPFSVQELLARLRAVLRRSHPQGTELRELHTDTVRIDFLAYEAWRDGHLVALTRKEFAVLRHLASHPDVVVRRDAILEEVWGYNTEVTTRTVDNHVASLRAKIEKDPREPRHLLTVHGVGYKWAS